MPEGRFFRENREMANAPTLDRVLVAVSSNGNRDDLRREAAEFGLKDVFADENSKVGRSFQVTATPSGVLIWPDATIGSYLAEGRDAIVHLIEDVLQTGPAGSLLTPGMPVPSLELPLVGGEKSSLHDSLLGADSVLLFWNPACYHCQSMRQDLRHWETHSRQSSDQLVVVSSGDTESSRSDGFASLVFLDPGPQKVPAALARMPGGTPMAHTCRLRRKRRIAFGGGACRRSEAAWRDVTKAERALIKRLVERDNESMHESAPRTFPPSDLSIAVSRLSASTTRARNEDDLVSWRKSPSHSSTKAEPSGEIPAKPHFRKLRSV